MAVTRMTREPEGGRVADDPAERSTAGDSPHQHAGRGGITEFHKDDQSLDSRTIAFWHNFGPTQFPWPEDRPLLQHQCHL